MAIKIDKDWMNEDNAHTLARAEEIKANPAEFKAAKLAAKRLAIEKKKEVAAFDKIVGSGIKPPKDKKVKKTKVKAKVKAKAKKVK